MPAPENRPDPAGTVYGGSRRAARSGPLADPLLRVALAVGLVGVLLGVVFATGLLGGDDEPVVPSTVGVPSSAAEPTTPAAEPSPTPSVEPSPTPSATTPAAPATGPRVLRSVSGLCLGLNGDGEKAEAELAVCTGGPEQQWVVSPIGPDTVTLTNAAHGQCLDVEGGSGDDGARLQQFPCHGEPNQQWRLPATGAGPVLLVAVHSGKCGQVDDDGVEAGDDVRQRPCDGRPAQQWIVG
ncbi:RICIN domain-containing protein [Micromonospora sp. WMMD710]|uniref:RICIN domain-containing protein n=1 Tax=Micromonospora sp. WMMD710 TaxID=3016085 RepID=UPI002416310A|nr:RICIN domain-containing protein [Micromonospora sp. WMMD710]MDG4759876.1 RICIN domain-containing protein [Micromonospora sp. WMMD710]